MRQIVWDEGGDRPCYLEIWDSDSVDDKIETACAKDMNPFSDLSLRVSSMPSVSLDGDDRIIGRLEVCNNNNANRRLKGMRIWGDRVLEDGSIQYEPNSSSKALPNCATWSSSVMCPTDTYATGVVVHSADKGDITGLQLVCRAVLKN